LNIVGVPSIEVGGFRERRVTAKADLLEAALAAEVDGSVEVGRGSFLGGRLPLRFAM